MTAQMNAAGGVTRRGGRLREVVRRRSAGDGIYEELSCGHVVLSQDDELRSRRRCGQCASQESASGVRVCRVCRLAKPLARFGAHGKGRSNARRTACNECDERNQRPHNRDWSAWWARQVARPDFAVKDAARRQARKAIKRGELVRQPCERCGAAKTEAHHDDYSQPLAVRWLCPSDHRQAHREMEVAS